MNILIVDNPILNIKNKKHQHQYGVISKENGMIMKMLIKTNLKKYHLNKCMKNNNPNHH